MIVPVAVLRRSLRRPEERNASEYVVKQQICIVGFEELRYSVAMLWLEVYNIVVHSSEGKEFKKMEFILNEFADLALASDLHLTLGPFLQIYGILFL